MKTRFKYYYVRASFMLTAMLLSCCQHFDAKHAYTHGLPNMGIPRIQCPASIPRIMHCNENLGDEVCDLFEASALHMNHELHFEFFVIGSRTKDYNMSSGTLLVTYPQEGPTKVDLFQKSQPAMSTHFRFEENSGCMREIAVLMMLPTGEFNAQSLDTLFRHELGHVLGLGHEEEGVFGLMQPGFGPDLVDPVELTVGELRLLKAAYPWIWSERL